jgi:hypothetical protein
MCIKNWFSKKVNPPEPEPIPTPTVVVPVLSITNAVYTLPWNPDPTIRWKTRDISAIKQIVIHQALGTKTAKATNEYHISKLCHEALGKGLPHLAYSFFIDYPSGEVLQCNDLEHITWHVANQNTKSVGICVGGFFNYGFGAYREEKPTQEQFNNLKLLVDKLVQDLGLTKKDVFTHDFLQGKPACPGIALAQFVKDYNGE